GWMNPSPRPSGAPSGGSATVRHPPSRRTPSARFNYFRARSFLLEGPPGGAGSAPERTAHTAHAQPWLANRVARYRARIGVEPAGVAVQDLGSRWGSWGAKLYFHWRSILLPPRIVDYIVAHELVHLVEPHHTPAFWARVERAMPEHAARRQWLTE